MTCQKQPVGPSRKHNDPIIDTAFPPPDGQELLCPSLPSVTKDRSSSPPSPVRATLKIFTWNKPFARTHTLGRTCSFTRDICWAAVSGTAGSAGDPEESLVRQTPLGSHGRMGGHSSSQRARLNTQRERVLESRLRAGLPEFKTSLFPFKSSVTLGKVLNLSEPQPASMNLKTEVFTSSAQNSVWI